MDKWWEKLDKTRHGRPYSELNEGLIYDDFKEMDEAINNLKNDYKKYSGFYLQELKSINIYFIYIESLL